MAKSSTSQIQRDPKRRHAPMPVDYGPRGTLLRILTSKSVRETVESVVIAFALAFLFRTFEAEAFVIPTGSMAPTLQGRHQEIDCPMCGYAFRLGASQEVDPVTDRKIGNLVAGQCPNCRYSACTDGIVAGQSWNPADQHGLRPFNSDAIQLATDASSANGDRIIVSKFAYEFREPSRWDVFVFRFPGQASRNYIKRLVGLPGDMLMIHHGDIWLAERQTESGLPPEDLKYEVERKPPEKVLAMAQVVYDNQHQAAVLQRNGWPERWTAWPRIGERKPGDWVASNDHAEFETDGSSDQESWLRYQHIIPSFGDWNTLIEVNQDADQGGSAVALQKFQSEPQLITDAYGYNSGFVVPLGGKGRDGSFVDLGAMGRYWVGDLVVECQVDVKGSGGVLVLDLVEGGVHFRCDIDVATGQAQLTIDGANVNDEGHTIAPPADVTPIKGPGTYDLTFANVDNQLLLWVDGSLVLNHPYPDIQNFIPKSDSLNGGDLAPVGIGSRGAKVRIGHLRILRDVYYVAISTPTATEYSAGPLALAASNTPGEFDADVKDVMTSKDRWAGSIDDDNQRRWGWFERMNRRYFALARDPDDRNKDQFLALGDNSPQSRDGRLWTSRTTDFFVERQLLIGKALVIYWPLSHIQFVR